MRLCITLFFILSTTINLFGGMRDAVDAIKIITVRSISQKILAKNRILLEGNVEILLDHKIHIWADSVEIDNDEKKIVACANSNGFVTLENADLVMLADYIELYLEKKTGCARNIKIHVKEGFLSSEKAEKLDNQTWQMYHIGHFQRIRRFYIKILC
jgi:lipopolysaccharide assembly outer membrane protein LptD (OstA)